MSNNLEVSFNSPQCGFMSIGFDDGTNEFHTTTAHAPHKRALPELLQILSALMDEDSEQNEYVLHWNREPEEFDFRFVREGESPEFCGLFSRRPFRPNINAVRLQIFLVRVAG
jgi:hypothetical protein